MADSLYPSERLDSSLERPSDKTRSYDTMNTKYTITVECYQIICLPTANPPSRQPGVTVSTRPKHAIRYGWVRPISSVSTSP